MNHGFVRLTDFPNRGAVEAALLNANVDSFKSLLEVAWRAEQSKWWVGVPGNDYLGCSVWLVGKNVAFRPGITEFSGWVMWSLMAAVKAHCGGKTRHEGVGAISVKKFPTWRAYFYDIFDHAPKERVDELWAMQRNCLVPGSVLSKLADL